MTTQNPLAILQAFSPQASQFTGQMQAGQNMATGALQQDLLRGQIRAQDFQNQGLEQEQNIRNTVNRLQEVERLIAQGATPEQLQGVLQGYIAQSEQQGGNPIDSIQALQALQQGGVEGLSGILGQAKQVFQQQGLIAAPKVEAQKQIDFAKIDPAKFTQESIAAAEQSGRYSDLVPIGDPAQEPAYLSELRKELRADVGKLESEAKSLTTNFNKLKNLAGEMRKGTNRSAVAQGLVALVKLGDPTSVVREEELKQALGAQSPTAAVADLLRDKGTSDGIVNAITQSIDPLNPSAVDVDGILATAEAILKPNAEAISESYNAARDRSGQLSEGGFKSIFGGSREKTFGDVASLSFGLSGSQQAPVEQPAEPQQQAIRQTFFDANGNPQEFELQGGQWVPVGAN